MRLIVTAGAHHLHLDLPDEEWPQWTVGRLRDEIKTLTSIPPENQRLIHRGKSIFGSDSTLESLRLKSGDRLMVLNSNQKPTDDPKLQQLRQIDTSRVKHLDRKIDDLKTQLDGIDKGFLDPKLQPEALGQIEKSLKHLNEECIRILELLDSFQLGEDEKDPAKIKRKSLVQAVQALLESLDQLSEKRRELFTRFQGAAAPNSTLGN